MLIDYYALLGLSRSATLEDIKHAYRRMAAIHHPDKSAFQGDEAESAETMTQLNEAMTVLTDPPVKQKYDYDLSFIPERGRPKPVAPPVAPPAPTPRAATPPPSAPKPRATPPPPAPTPRVTPLPTPKPRVTPPPPTPTPRVAAPPPAPPPPKTLRSRLLTLPLTWKDLRWNSWALSLEATRAGSEPLVLVERHFETLAPATVQVMDQSIAMAMERHPDFLKTATIILITCRRITERDLVIKELEQVAKKGRGWFKNKPMLAVYDEHTKTGIRIGQRPDQGFTESVLAILLSA